MTAFTVWKFDSPDGAEHAAKVIKQAEAEKLLKLHDHAVVSWPEGASRPDTHHGHDDQWHGSAWGAFWGVLLGALFFVPVLGAAAGAGAGALAKSMQGVGIDKQQLDTIRTQVTEGTSALFLVTEEADLDRLGERFGHGHSQLIATNLTDAERALLLETFTD